MFVPELAVRQGDLLLERICVRWPWPCRGSLRSRVQETVPLRPLGLQALWSGCRATFWRDHMPAQLGTQRNL